MKKFLVLLSGIYLSLIGVLILLLNIITFIIVARRPDIKLPKATMILSNIIVILFASWPLLTGIGLIIKKNWARISMFILSGLAFFMGLIGSLVSLAIFMIKTPDANPKVTKIASLSLLGFYGIFFIIIPVFFIVFFSRKSVKEIFVSKTGENVENKRPLGITLIALFLLIGGFSSLVLLSQNFVQKIPLIGPIIISGVTLKVYSVVIALINIYIGIGLLKLWKSAWITTIVTNVLFGLMGLINIFTISEAIISQTVYSGDMSNFKMSLASYRISLVAGLLIWVFILSYLVFKRNLFLHPKQLENRTSILKGDAL